MPDRQFVYRVEIDARQAAAAASQVRSVMQRELNQIRFSPQGAGAGGAASTIGRSLGGGINRGGGGNELIPGFGNVSQLAGYTVAGVAISQLGRMAVGTTVALTEQGTTLRRADFAAQQLAGSTERLSNLMRVYQQATGDAQTEGEALATVNRLMAVGFADTEQELRRFVTGARGAAIATGQDLAYIQSQLQLSIANQSTMRLDQLGLGIEEVQGRVESLKDTMPELTTEARYQEAVLGLLNEKYGALVTDAEAGASGLELLTKQFRELREEMARGAEQNLNPIFEGQAVRMGSQNVPAQARQLRRMAQTNSMLPGSLGGQAADEIWAFHRAASLLEEVDAAARRGEQGMEDLQTRVIALTTEMNMSGQATSANITQLTELERVYRLTANGGIVYADSMSEADRAAQRLAESQAALNAQFAEAQRLLRFSYQGQTFVNLPNVGLQPEQGPGGPTDEWLRQRSVMQGGGFLTPGGAAVGDVRGDWMSQWRQQNEEDTRAAIREREQAEQRAIRESESAWKSAARVTEQAFRDAARELESSLRAIPGLFGASSVTQEQMDLAKLGVGQNFVDDVRRRLEDEVINKHDWADIDPAAIFAQAGIDASLDPKAQIALFNQKWADQSLFADKANLSFLNQDAIRAELERQKMSELGQQNILSMFGLTQDSEGTMFADLGATMAGGMKAGAEEGLAEFGREAIANVVTQLSNDSAITEYTALGGDIGGAIWTGLIGSVGNSDLVNAITAEVLAQIAEYLPPE